MLTDAAQRCRYAARELITGNARSVQKLRCVVSTLVNVVYQYIHNTIRALLYRYNIVMYFRPFSQINASFIFISRQSFLFVP